MTSPRFTILLAHGSSDPNWLAPFVALEQRVVQRQPNVGLAFMELAEPSLAAVISNASQQGFRAFTVLPLFFAAGRHLRQDVPRQLHALEQELGVEIDLLAPIGEHPALADAIALVIQQTLDHAHTNR